MDYEEIIVLCEYSLPFSGEPFPNQKGSGRFKKELSTGEIIHFDVSLPEQYTNAWMEGVKIPRKFTEELSTLSWADGDKLSEEASKAIEGPLNKILTSTNHLLSLIKYHLPEANLYENLISIRSKKWGRSWEKMLKIPQRSKIELEIGLSTSLNMEKQSEIQNLLNKDFYPLDAMRHLHRAVNERQPHHRWTDATTAAELAIKEAITRARPDLKEILYEVPSPPLRKLYGSIMKKYLGKESDFKNNLDKGQQKRNKIIHQPNTDIPTSEQARDYLRDVQGAIDELIEILKQDI